MKIFYSLLLLFSLYACDFAFAKETILRADLVEGIATEKNYLISRGHFEANSISWDAYANGVSVPSGGSAGTGGSPSVTCSQVTTANGYSIPSGVGAFRFSKGATNRQGDGCSIPFTIDPKHQGTVLRIDTAYSISGSGYADDDLKFYVVDITNGRVIEPSANLVKKHLIRSGAQAEPMEFQTSLGVSDALNYRLLIHQASNNAAAYDLVFDDIKIGKQNSSRGPPVTDKVAYTAGVSGYATGSYTLNYANWKRVGQYTRLEFRFTKDASAGTGSTAISISVPSGMVIDSSITQNYFGGSAGSGNATNGNYEVYYDTSSGNIKFLQNDATNLVGSEWQAGSSIGGFIEFPVQGQSSNTVTSDQANVSDVAFRARKGSQGGLSIGNWNTLTYTASDISGDTLGGFRTATNDYLIKVPGWYFIHVMAATNTPGAATIGVSTGYRVDGGSDISMSQSPNITGFNGIGAGSDLIYLRTGQTVQFRVLTTVTDATVSVPAALLFRLPSNQQIAATDTYGATYTGAPPTGTLANAFNVITFPTKVDDSHGSYVGSTFTVKTPGRFNIHVQACQSASYTAGGAAVVGIAIDGAVTYTVAEFTSAAITSYLCPQIDIPDVPLRSGQTVSAHSLNNGTGPTFVTPLTGMNQFSIIKVGNY